MNTMRGPNDGTGTLSGHGSALKIARWWHSEHDIASDRTPLARMLPRVIGGPASHHGRFRRKLPPSLTWFGGGN
jgi:hypothetical protein